MPLDPEELDGIGDEVAAHYSALELAVLAAVAEVARRGIERPGWAAEQARQFPRLAGRIRRLVSEGTSRGVSLAADAVSEAARRGRDTARADLAAIEETVARRRAVPPAVRPVDGGRVFGPTPARVTPQPSAQAQSGPRDLAPVSVAQVPPSPASATVAAVRAEAARQATTEALEQAGRAVTERALNRWQQVVAEMARAELAGDATSLQVQQRVLDEWARRGLPAFTDKAGRTWSMQAYAEMNVRTATHQAFGDAHRAELAGAGMDLVIVSSHRNPADVCQPYERKVLSLSGRLSGTVQVPSATSDELVTVQVYSSLDIAKANGYDHPNCFPAGTLVTSRGGIEAADRRWYDGKMVTVHTAGGHKLTGTPNHPVLTSKGWVALGSLTEGDNVVRNGGTVELPMGDNPDDVSVPTPIGEVFESLRQSVEMATVSVPTSAEDFHGDGGHGDVDVVLANGLLRDRGKAPRREVVGELKFLRSGTDEGFLPRLRPILQFLFGAFLAPKRLVGRGNKGEALFRRGLGVSLSRLGGRGDLRTESANPVRDSRLRGPKRFRDLFLRCPSEKHLDHRFGVIGDKARVVAEAGCLSGGSGHSSVTDSLFDPRLTDANGGRELLTGLTGKVSFDEVVHVDVSEFAGHVYNLETGSGWYIADNFIVHNCKHTESAYVPGVSRPGGTRPNPAGYAATQEQRRLERGIREWKRREAVALSDEARAKARAKVLEWQGRTREHIKVHGLDRRYYREQVRVGAA